ncbi:polymer-forming cytoskeletal protein [Sinanaerobacter chloroacetimidivorans]|uniref:Polymer-forming cytoskeletal protein n=1 Tax=Sinanaerobacter chloroacetimidivorans TaxID=2818044 RepID=A0A8J7W171_9FIRM|nr:polymer-forming cytoskeletal protein [Sinanaerobacter chloroacetimidivorans]MBR0597286.1 polymer-forming cytoskeletal protein [Sinanaerobacter chloroacetimidivorans]
MSDLDDKAIGKIGGGNESFSDLMKKMVEKQLEEKSADSPAETLSVRAEEPVEEPVKETMKEPVKEPVELSAEEEAPQIVKQEPVVMDWKQEEKPVESYQPVSEVGVISSSTSILGTVSSKGHIRVEGSVTGDVFAYGDIKVTGKVNGDIDGGNIELEGCDIEGDIKARGDVNVGKGSVLNGDMNGQLITIDGTIKGNITAQKGAHMSGTSVVKGSITAATLSMSSGAELQGRVNVSLEDES